MRVTLAPPSEQSNPAHEEHGGQQRGTSDTRPGDGQRAGLGWGPGFGAGSGSGLGVGPGASFSTSN